ncbi:MAG: ribosome maturation factor RimM [Actinomycetota bacterium]
MERRVPDRVVVGRIVSAHGIKGECAIEVLSEAPDRFDPGAELDAELPDGSMTILTVRASRPHKQRLLVFFDEVGDRNGAEAIRGTWLSVNAEHAAELPDGLYYAHQLEGCEVQDEQGMRLGVLSNVLENPAHDIWVVETDSGVEAMVPAVKEFIRDVDVDARRIVIAPIEGMF